METTMPLNTVEEVNEWLKRNILLENKIEKMSVASYKSNEAEFSTPWNIKSKTKTHCKRSVIETNYEEPLKQECPIASLKYFENDKSTLKFDHKSKETDSISPPEGTKFPFSAFGLLIIKIDESQFTLGTGVLIDEDKVLTVIQNIWDETTNCFYPKDCISFYPGFNHRIAPFGSFKVVDTLLPRSYSPKSLKDDSKEAFVVLLLSEPIGKKIGYLGLEFFQESVIKGKRLFSLQYISASEPLEEQNYQQKSTSSCSQFMQKNIVIEFLGDKDDIQKEFTNINSERLKKGSSGWGIIYYHNEKNDQYYVVGTCKNRYEADLDSDQRMIAVTKATVDHFFECQYRVKEKFIDLLKPNCEDEIKDTLELFKIDLSFTKIEEEKMEILSAAPLSKLGTLLLVNCNVGPKIAKIIGRNQSWVNLEYLDLRSNAIEDISASHLGSNYGWKCLKKLVLCSNKIGNCGAIALGKNSTWNELEVLDLANNQISCKGAAAIASNRNWKRLKKLILANNIICDKGAAEIGKVNSWINLEEINLSCNKIGDEGANIIGSNSFWKTLKKLALSDNLLKDESAIAIAKNKSWLALRVLDLRSNQIGNKGAAALARNTVWSSLQTLALSGNVITQEGALALSKSNSWLCLEGLYLGFNLIKSKGVCGLVENVTWKNLIKLELSMSDVGNEGAVKIGKNKSWVYLEELLLSGNSIGDEGAIAIARNDSWRYLRILDLASNMICDKGAMELGKNSSWNDLEQLRLSGNKIGYKGTVVIANNSCWENIDTIYLGRNQTLIIEERNVVKYCTLLGAKLNMRI